MSYSQWVSSLHIPHLKAAAESSPTPPPPAARLSLQVECSCGRLHPHAAFLYWCRSCACLQCGQCAHASVDTYFCPSCLNSVFTSPAFANQNRCEQCAECPDCGCLLAPTTRPSGAVALVCEYCKYCSEDYTPAATQARSGEGAGLLTAPESSLLSARIKDAEQNAGANATFASLLAHYRAKTQKVHPSSGSMSMALGGLHSKRPTTLIDEGDDAGVLARLAALSATTTEAGTEGGHGSRWMVHEAREAALARQHYTLPTEPVINTCDPIPHALLGIFDEHEGSARGKQPKSIEDLSTIEQRLCHPSGQHLLVNELVPRHKALSTKLAQRCRSCNKYLVKPGPGASKPNMEIHTAAVSHIPTVTIGQFREMRVGRPTSIILYFKNPLEKVVNLWLTLPGEASTNNANATDASTAGTPSSSSSAAANSSCTANGRSYPPATAELEFVRASVQIAAYDDEETADDTQKLVEPEPALVVYRHLSKVGLLLHVTPTTHLRSTHFVLLVHMQPESSALAAASPAGAALSPVPTPSPANTDAITVPIHVNLGFANPAQE